MVNIILSNKNTHSKCRRIVFDTNANRFLLENNQQLQKNELADVEFEHPLLVYGGIQLSDNIYHYQYSDIDGLFEAAIYVYATLLQAESPAECSFQISPSSNFFYPKATEQIYCSLNATQLAKESISLENFEHLISELTGGSFKFINSFLIRERFTTKDLPQSINGDLLFTAREQLVDLLKSPCQLNKYELRYIDPVIGFGLFARENLQKDEMLFSYSGEKKIFGSDNKTYVFGYTIDFLKMHIDALRYGSIARFVNHAPQPCDKASIFSHLLYANVNAISENVNGIEIVCFEAARNILKGEQLLINYGENFVKTYSTAGFTNKGRVIYKSRGMNLWKRSQIKMAHIKLMAKHGLKKASYYILLRLLLISLVLFILLKSL